MKFFFFECLMALMSLAVAAQTPPAPEPRDFAVDGVGYNILSEEEGTVEVTYSTVFEESAKDFEGTLVIPESVVHEGKSYRVVRIGELAFGYLAWKMSAVELPHSLVEIGSQAFAYCENLTEVEIPGSVTYMEGNVFHGCTSLAKLIFADGEAPLELSGWTLFCMGSSIPTVPLKEVYIGRDMECTSYYSGSGLFSDTATPFSVTVGANVSSLGRRLFANSLMASVDLPDGLEMIGTETFSQCGRLSRVRLPNSVTAVGSRAFAECDSLSEVSLYVPGPDMGRPLALGEYAFSNCLALAAADLPSGTVIGKGAFSGCSSLAEVRMADGVAAVGDYAFNSCALKEIDLPGSVLRIGERSFYGCRALEAVGLHEGLDSIGERAFASCSALKEIRIPNSVTAIGEYAFQGCASLASASTGHGVVDLNECVFSVCGSLNSLSLGRNVAYIGRSFASDCKGLKQVYSYNPVPPVMDWWSVFPKEAYDNAVLYVPQGALEAYRNASWWSSFVDIREMNASGAGAVKDGKVRVRAGSGCITVEGLEGGLALEVYDMGGRLVYSGKGTRIAVPQEGGYVVKVGGGTFKVFCGGRPD